MIEEELTHLMYELLSPKKNPERWRLYLELFDKHVLRLEMTTAELDSAEVHEQYKTELLVKKLNLPPQKKKKMDLAIITSRRFIPIEVKIEAGSGKSQCDDYLREAQLHTRKYSLNEPPVLYYLTLHGYFPERASATNTGYGDSGDLAIHQDKIIKVTFRTELLPWLEDCATHAPENFSCRNNLSRLLSFVRKITQRTNEQLQVEEIMRKFFSALEKHFDENFCKKYHLKRGSSRRAEVGDAYDYKRFINRFFGKAFSWPSICLQCTDAAGNVIKLDDDKELWFRVGCYNDRYSYLNESTAFCAGFIIFSHEVKEGLYKETDIKPLLNGKNILPQESVDEYDKKFNGLVGRTDLHDAQGNLIHFTDIDKTLRQFGTQQDIDSAVEHIMTEIKQLLERFVNG